MFKNQGELPDEAKLFLRIHKTHLNESQPTDTALVMRDEPKLSVDWEELTTAEESRARGKVPQDNGVAVAISGLLRQKMRSPLGDILLKSITHDPVEGDENTKPNESHSLIIPVSYEQSKKVKKTGKYDYYFDNETLATIKDNKLFTVVIEPTKNG